MRHLVVINGGFHNCQGTTQYPSGGQEVGLIMKAFLMK